MKIIYYSRVLFSKKLYFLKINGRGYNTNNLYVLNLELNDWTV